MIPREILGAAPHHNKLTRPSFVTILLCIGGGFNLTEG
jgi:hypothetical protein